MKYDDNKIKKKCSTFLQKISTSQRQNMATVNNTLEAQLDKNIDNHENNQKFVDVHNTNQQENLNIICEHLTFHNSVKKHKNTNYNKEKFDSVCNELIPKNNNQIDQLCIKHVNNNFQQIFVNENTKNSAEKCEDLVQEVFKEEELLEPNCEKIFINNCNDIDNSSEDKCNTNDDSIKSENNGNKNNKNHICLLCSQTFDWNYQLKQHIKKHNGIKEYKCLICEKVFSLKHHLANHTKLHSGVKNFRCKICHRMFRQYGTLADHMKIHLNIHDFKCNECGKLFRTNSNLKTHTKTHVVTKNVQCTVCNKLFRDEKDLKVHMKCHSKQKQFQCCICDKYFVLKHQLKEHLQSHSDKKDFQCVKCLKMFKYKKTLKIHNIKNNCHEKNINTVRNDFSNIKAAV